VITAQAKKSIIMKELQDWLRARECPWNPRDFKDTNVIRNRISYIWDFSIS
jgi:hypothetical protein